MWRRSIVLGLLVIWMASLGASCQAQLPPPEVAVAKLPPDLMAAKRKTVADALLTGILVYQQFRPVVAATCVSPDCQRDLEKTDDNLKDVFSTFWAQLFTWPVAPAGYNEVDWGKLLADLLNLLLKLGKYVPVRAIPIIPGIPQVAPPRTGHLLPGGGRVTPGLTIVDEPVRVASWDPDRIAAPRLQMPEEPPMPSLGAADPDLRSLLADLDRQLQIIRQQHRQFHRQLPGDR